MMIKNSCSTDPIPIGLVCCSNGMRESFRPSFMKLLSILEEANFRPVYGKHLFAENGWKAGGSAKERADDLMELYRDPSVRAVFDLSGGDLANEILPLLDYNEIQKNGREKILFGYSDLTTVLNAVYTKTGCACGLYQLRNLLYSHGEEQLFSLLELFGRGEARPLTDLSIRFLRGSSMEGTAVGGNVRCFLKLAGTEYFPDLTGKILILESNSGGPDRLSSYLAQLSQLGAFEKVNGILLGTFTEAEEKGLHPTVGELLLSHTKGVPVAVTRDIGHGSDARCAIIGKKLAI